MTISSDPTTKKAASQSAGTSTFPTEISNSPVHFNIQVVSYSNSPGITTTSVGQTKYSVYLPLPMGLRNDFNIEYDDYAFGALGGAIETARNVINNPGSIAGALESAGKALGMAAVKVGSESLGAALGQSSNGKAKAVGQMIQGAGGSINNGLQLAVGAIQNPNLAVLFRGVNIRKHNFSWKFTCKNSSEAATLQSIIKQLQSSALPALDNGQSLLLDYPDVAMLSLVGVPSGLVTFSSYGTFIENISADYGEGNIALFNDYNPVEVNLSITFRERSIITADDLK